MEEFPLRLLLRQTMVEKFPPGGPAGICFAPVSAVAGRAFLDGGRISPREFGIHSQTLLWKEIPLRNRSVMWKKFPLH